MDSILSILKMSVSFVNDSKNGSSQRAYGQYRPSSGRDSQPSVRPRSEGSNVTMASRGRQDGSLISKETSYSASSDAINSQSQSKDSEFVERQEKRSDVRVLPRKRRLATEQNNLRIKK